MKIQLENTKKHWLFSAHFCNEQKQSPRGILQKMVSWKILQNLQENSFARVSLLKNFIKKETLTQVFSCELYEIFKTPFPKEPLQWLLLNVVLVNIYYIIR